MACSPSYIRSNYNGDKVHQKQSYKKTKESYSTNYNVKTYAPQTKTSYGYSTNVKNNYSNNRQYNGSPKYNTYDYQVDYIDYDYNSKQNQKSGYYPSYKMSNSAYSTMASEADQDSELSGFKISQSGKVIHDGQYSDFSDSSSSSPTEDAKKREANRFASAISQIGPNPQTISMPSFI